MNVFEANILIWIQNNLRGVMDGFWIFVTHLGDKGQLWILIGIALLFFKKTRKTGIALFITLSVGFLFTNVLLKNWIARIRPYNLNPNLIPLIRKPRDYSFPSGHTSAAFSAMIALYLRVPKKYGIPALVMASLVALSRLYVGVHYPTDVLGGIVIAIFSNVIIYYGEKFISKKRQDRVSNS